MKKKQIIAIMMTSILMLTGCGGQRKTELLAHEHGLSEDVQAASDRMAETEQWMGQEICVPDGQALVEDEEVDAAAALFFSLEKPEAVYAKNVYQKLNPASITTLFTAYVVLQERSLSDTVTVTADAVSDLYRVSAVGLKPGDQLTVEQLLYGMLLCSGVDAANVLAIDTAGSMDAFVRMMNTAAKECGCVDTQFQNPNGLTQTGHYTSAYDIYRIMQCLSEDARFMKIFSTKTYQAIYKDVDGNEKEETYTSTVQFIEDGISQIGFCEIVGGKTGTTQSAGHCLALLCQNQEGELYVAVVMKASSKERLYEQIEHIVKKI